MLCSKHAKQPEGRAALGSSFVMKHIRLVLILAFVAAIVAACGSSGPRAVPDDAVAVVGGDTITKSEFDKILNQAKRSYAAQHRAFPKAGTQQYTALQGQIVQFLVERSEYDQEAKKMGIKVSDKEVADRLNQVKQQYFVNPSGQKPATKAQIEKRYQAQLKAQGLTDQDVREGVRSQLIREKIYNKVTKDVKVSDSDAKKYYDDHKSQYKQPAVPESRDVRHILVKSQAKALAVYNQLKHGGDFAKLALKYSIDPSKSNGGKLTICKKQSVSCLKTVPNFEKTAFALKTNEISKPVHTQFGWHVIQALSPIKPATKASTLPFDQVKSAIQQQLLQQKKQDEMNKWWNKTKKSFQKKTAYQTGYTPPSTSTTTTQTTTTG
jgi:parvulin-like peptidyl-prolyl isomerase